MEKLELLAPAQNYDCAIAAINSGADALYLGAPKFGARKNASNSLDDIEKIVNYAHLFNVKVYITLNTILDDKELIECEELIEELYKIKVDAIIIQDMGLLELPLPPIVLHGSTQCDIRSVDKVKFLEKVGFKRVVLARETPIELIEKIRKETNIELEHFVFGSFCTGFSGQCYLSAYSGKRSANRGDCAQPCRKKYSLVDEEGNFIIKNKYLLSLKDNNLSNHLERLIKAGVKSFKIEGRLKDINYVKNSVLYFHNKLKNYPRQSKGIIIQDFTPSLDKTFNRGFCDDYLFNKKDNIYNFLTPKSQGEFLGEVVSSNDKSFCINTKKELNCADGLCFEIKNELAGCLVNKIEKTKTGFKIFPNKKLFINKNTKIYRNIDKSFEKTLNNTKTTRKLEVRFIVTEEKLILIDKDNNKVSIDIEAQEFALNSINMRENFKKSLSKTANSPYLVKDVAFELDNIPFLPVSKINELRNSAISALSKKILDNYRTKKQKPINHPKFPQEKGDYRLNVHNKKAMEFYKKCDCEVIEGSFESIKEYKNKELMRSKHCLKKALFNCSYNKKLYLLDDKGVKYPLIFDCKNCEMAILAP